MDFTLFCVIYGKLEFKTNTFSANDICARREKVCIVDKHEFPEQSPPNFPYFESSMDFTYLYSVHGALHSKCSHVNSASVLCTR